MNIIEKAVERLEDEPKSDSSEAIVVDDELDLAGAAPNAGDDDAFDTEFALDDEALGLAEDDSPAPPPASSGEEAAATTAAPPGGPSTPTPGVGDGAVASGGSRSTERATEPATGYTTREAEADKDDDSGTGRTQREVELDFAYLQAGGVVTPDLESTVLAEQYRLIKRPLLMQAAIDNENALPRANLIMVGSAIPGEGKTHTAINLATSIAMERDRTVLLVDGDIAKADVSRVLGFEGQEGLTDCLVKSDQDLSKYLVRTNIPKLQVLPAGYRYPNMTELLAGPEMKRLAAELSERYRDRIVIFDSPPLLATSGASVLATLVGQIVLVVEAIRTSQRAVREALGMLDSLDNVGLVLNKTREGLGAPTDTGMDMATAMDTATATAVSKRMVKPGRRAHRSGQPRPVDSGHGRAVRVSCALRSLVIGSAAIGVLTHTVAVSAGEWRITPRAALSETYTDNVSLSGEGDESSSLVTDATAGVTVRGQGSRINLLGLFNIERIFRTSGNDGDRTNQQWQLTSDLEWLKRIGFLNVRTTRRQENISNTGNTSTSNINTGSRRNVTTLSVNPSIRHRFGDYADSSLRIGFNLVSNEVDDDSSDTQSTSVTSSLTSGNHFARMPWSLRFDRRNVTNTDNSESEFNSTQLNVSYVVSRQFSVDFGAGMDNNEFSSSQDSSDGFRWEAGATWRPGPRTTLQVGLDQRFFNDENFSYFLDFSHTSRRTRWRVRYREDVTTSEREQVERNLVALVDPFGNVIEDPDTSAPILVPIEFVVPTDEVIVVRRFDADMTISRRRGSISLNAFSRDRDFQLSDDSETQLGAGLSLTQQMSRGLSANAGLNAQFNEPRGDGETEIRWTASAGLSYTISDWLSGSLRYRHTELFSDDENAEFAENQLAARFNARF